MKKAILFSAIIFCASILTQAQVPVRFGIDPGVALSKAMYKPFAGERRVWLGFDGGVLVEVGAKRLRFQGEVNYSMNGVELNDGVTEYTIKNSYVNVSPLLKLKFAKVSLLTGPQMEFLLSSKADYSGSQGTFDMKDQFKKSGFDWVFGGEIKITKNVFLGLRYTLGLTNISDRLNFEMKNRYTSFRIGYMLDFKK
jgi:hypothetical protein